MKISLPVISLLSLGFLVSCGGNIPEPEPVTNVQKSNPQVVASGATSSGETSSGTVFSDLPMAASGSIRSLPALKQFEKITSLRKQIDDARARGDLTTVARYEALLKKEFPVGTTVRLPPEESATGTTSSGAQAPKTLPIGGDTKTLPANPSVSSSK